MSTALFPIPTLHHSSAWSRAPYWVCSTSHYPCPHCWSGKWTLRWFCRPSHSRFEGTGRRKPHFFFSWPEVPFSYPAFVKEGLHLGVLWCLPIIKQACTLFHISLNITWSRTHGAAEISRRTYSHPESLHPNIWYVPGIVPCAEYTRKTPILAVEGLEVCQQRQIIKYNTCNNNYNTM